MNIKVSEFLAGGIDKSAANAKQTSNADFSNIFGAIGNCNECLVADFAVAADEYMDSVLQGQGGITEEAIDARLEDFTMKFAPDEPATEQEFTIFAEKFAEFTFRLYELLEGTNAKEAAHDFMRAKMPCNPSLQQQLQTERGTK